MNKMTVGMENLPNVFIEKVFVFVTGDVLAEDYNQRISITLAMYDHFPNRSWLRPEMSDLKVKIGFITDNSIASLTTGQKSLYSYPPSNNPGGIENKVLVIDAKDFNRSGGTETIHTFKKSVEVIMDRTANLSIYAACFLDGLDLGSDMLNKFYGPMQGESVYVNGEINEQSGYFYYPETNKEYAGPVHQHPGSGFMEGSKHSDVSHSKLRYVSEENYKLTIVKGVTDPNELLPSGPGPQSGAGNQRKEEGLAGIEEPDVNQNTDPLTEIQEGGNNGGSGSFENPDSGNMGGGYNV